MMSMFLIHSSCCDENIDPSSQKITYRLSVTDMGYKMHFCFDSITHAVLEPGVYDTTFFRNVNEQCCFTVIASCSNDQKISFIMQILRNDVEVKSKSYTRHNICGDVNLCMNYLIIP